MKMRRSNSQAGFSLLEVIIAMGITVTILTLATTLLAAGFRVRSNGFNAVHPPAARRSYRLLGIDSDDGRTGPPGEPWRNRRDRVG